jgi:3-deoxy-D-manno-octulosonate 8-phosphate phosphatase (KDO 8-P phosphatase)
MNDKNFKGLFAASPEAIAARLKDIKAFVFDWDGVFNDGKKDAGGSGYFSEVDAMGTNLLRFNHYLLKKEVPLSAIISGEKNDVTFTFAKREHFHAVYFGVKHKLNAIEHFCSETGLAPENIAFFFDDVLDFSAASVAGLRIMIGRASTPLLKEYAQKNNYVDYITAFSGGEHGLRESAELLLSASGLYNETLDHRVQSSEIYKSYLDKRNRQATSFYSSDKIEPVTV